MAEVMGRIEGVVIGLLMGLEDGIPQVVFPGNPEPAAVPARSLAVLDYAMIGSEMALLFEGGDPARPIIVGPLVRPDAGIEPPVVVRDGETLSLTAAERIELRCGQASIVLRKDGHVTIRGTQLNSQASGANHVRGGSVHLN